MKTNSTTWTQNGRNYEMTQYSSGHWGLMVNGLQMLDDSANEDYYEFESAKASFVDYIDEYEAEIAEFLKENE